jgi:hypothetical protein
LGGVGLVGLADAMGLHNWEIYRIFIVKLRVKKEPKGSEVGIKVFADLREGLARSQRHQRHPRVF